MTRHYRYQVPSQEGEGWAILFLDEAGCFAAVSDWGDFSHRFGGFAKGEGIRELLLQAHDEYLVRKIAPDERYSEEKTLLELKRDVLRWRADGCRGRFPGVTKELARQFWDGLLALDLSPWGDQAPPSIMDWAGYGECSDAESIQTEPVPGAVAFLTKAWPRLRKLIQADVTANPLPKEGT